MGGGSLKRGPSLFKRDMDSLFLPDLSEKSNPIWAILGHWPTFLGRWAIFGPVRGIDFPLE